MKKKGIILALVALACLLFAIPTNKDASAAEAATEVVTWELVTGASELAVGDFIVIAAKNSNYALSTTQNTNNRGQATITRDENKIELSSNVQILEVKAGTTSGTLSFYTGEGYLYAAGGTGKNNYMKTQTTLNAAGSWNVSIDNSTGVATIKTADSSVVRHTMKYNSSSSLFSCYASGQADVCIYKKIVTILEDEVIEVENVSSDAISELFSKYYSLGGQDGFYTKETTIYIDPEKIGNELEKYFHAKCQDLERVTYYKGNELWMSSPSTYDYSGYGTENGKLTQFRVNLKGVKTTPVKTNLVGMEEYFLTLYDFVKGSHVSSHETDPSLVNLTSDWTKDANGVYYNTQADVKEAFRLFTAPVWLGKKAENANYIDYTQVTMEVVGENLVMTLWVSVGEVAGKLSSKTKVVGTNAIFSQAIISNKSFEVNDAEYIYGDYSYTFNKVTYEQNGNLSLNNVDWTLAGDGNYWGYDTNASNKGQQFGSSKAPYTNLALTTTNFKYTNKVVITAAGATDIVGTLKVMVGGVQLGNVVNLTKTSTEYTFESSELLEGDVVIVIEQTSSVAVYIKSISVDYAIKIG